MAQIFAKRAAPEQRHLRFRQRRIELLQAGLKPIARDKARFHNGTRDIFALPEMQTTCRARIAFNAPGLAGLIHHDVEGDEAGPVGRGDETRDPIGNSGVFHPFKSNRDRTRFLRRAVDDRGRNPPLMCDGTGTIFRAHHAALHNRGNRGIRRGQGSSGGQQAHAATRTGMHWLDHHRTDLHQCLGRRIAKRMGLRDGKAPSECLLHEAVLVV